jgi:CBS domain containing-hemolysin-like protein
VSKKEKTKQSKQKWVLTVVCLSFGLSVVMSFVTSIFVESAGLLVALLSLIVLVMIGIVTDIIGTAVTSANEQPFIAMASKRITGARQALSLIRKAERVSSLLNDVVGDIVGIISGSAGSVIAVYLVSLGLKSAVASMLITAFTSAFMIGGKAYGKGIAVEKSETIVLTVGRMMAMFEKKLRCKPKKKKA